MVDSVSMAPGRRRLAIMATSLMAIVLLLLVFRVVGAQEARGNPLDQSDKTASTAMASPGATVGYSIVIDNSGVSNLPSVVMTDTIPSEMTYVADSVDVVGGGVVDVTAGVLTWSGGVNAGAQITVNFDATINQGVGDGIVITNTAVISGGGFLVSPEAYVTVVTDTVQYFPVVFNLPPTVVLNDPPPPDETNSWTLTWTPSTTSGVTGYEIHEALDPAFTQGLVTYASATTSLNVTKPSTGANVFYYRVRALGGWGSGPWSNVRQQVGIFRDDFNNNNADWRMRRQDTDDVDNAVYVQNGHLVLEMNSRWDYVIASPMVPAMQPPYQIETRMQFSGVDNLHSYGIIFGGDWNGQTCPNANYTSCFNHYYRLTMIWYGAPNRLRVQLKRVDYHDASDNAGRGPTLWGPSDITVNAPPETWQIWTIQVHENNQIDLYVNGGFVFSLTDNYYTNEPYFGLFAATDEYTGLDAWIDWYEVTPLN